MSLTLEQALEVLNQHQHRGSHRWRIVESSRGVSVSPFHDTPSPAWLSEFEAIAIATYYEQTAPGQSSARGCS